jgi:hypothetical protein
MLTVSSRSSDTDVILDGRSVNGQGAHAHCERLLHRLDPTLR